MARVGRVCSAGVRMTGVTGRQGEVARVQGVEVCRMHQWGAGVDIGNPEELDALEAAREGSGRHMAGVARVKDMEDMNIPNTRIKCTDKALQRNFKISRNCRDQTSYSASAMREELEDNLGGAGERVEGGGGAGEQVEGVEEAERYHRLYYNLHGGPVDVDVGDTEALDSYEKIFQESYNKHMETTNTAEARQPEEVEEEEEERMGERHKVTAEGRVYVGEVGARHLEEVVGGRHHLTMVEVAATLSARLTNHLVADHFNPGEPRVRVRARVEEGEVVVTVLVEGREGEDCRVEAFTTCSIAMANIFQAVKDRSPGFRVSDIRVLS